MNYTRLKLIFIGFILAITLLFSKISYYAIFLHRQYALLSVNQRIHTYIFNSNRGDIVDRNLLKLTDREKQEVIVYPNEMDKEIIFIIEKSIRNPQIAQHLIGTVGYAPFYKVKGLQGLSGLERQYDRELAGREGKVIMVVDSSNRPLYDTYPRRVDGKKNENTLVTTLCSVLQERLENVIDGEKLIERGAVIVMNPYNGQVYAMISRPTMNFQNIDDGSHLNKGVQIHRNYHPASVFKKVIGLYALEQGVDPNRQFICKDLCKYSHGQVTFEEGFALSCNQVFYDLVLEFGADEILAFAQKLGFGEKTGIGLDNEGRGRLPARETVIGKKGSALLALGQGELEVTPIQIAKLTGIIANGGYQITPQIVYYIGKNPHKVPDYKNLGPRIIDEKSVSMLKEMMRKTTIFGTAQGLKGFGGVKTGTADNQNRWLTGFFPAENPQLVVTIFIEEGYGKSTIEVSKRIIETIFNLN
ncbi:peptidoglycan D,D-transpeptidase FtsI family protein [Anaerobranca gottschalkii]|uniref:Penicillin-binding protein 2 n=1 Tax=Anaerobranca gottschalkii DSM 13577 TaxID=1120990 RepID=A0A1H9Y4Q2_9FIRM|nr:penicillin-binding transpeptidase domain-containing protein [Anaerobranca gottschalkii]SES63744.1 penicillin-binding protein 2 [Anaerobranca gottschalkii DSM 13577]